MNDSDRLNQLVKARYPCIAISTFEETEALQLVRKIWPAQWWWWTASEGVVDGTLADTVPVRDTTHPAAGLFYLSQRIVHPLVAVTFDLASSLQDAKVLRLLRELIQKCQSAGSTLILIDHAPTLPTVIEAHATRFELSLPDDAELEQIIRRTLQNLHGEARIEIGISRREFQTVIRNLRGLVRRQVDQIIRDVVGEDRRFDSGDIVAVLARKRRALHGEGLLEYVETPADLSCIGGLRRLKLWLQHRAAALTPEAEAFGLPAPRGVLMLGVQGAGKSLCAKAIATAWQRPLLRLDPGVLYDRFVGESERRLREALRAAEAMAPIVLWIDEIEKAFASAASRSTDGGLSQRMFGTLLTWMTEHEAAVFLVATANDIEALPPELMRKGRFDEIFFVDLPEEGTRQEIFAIHLGKRGRQTAEFDLPRLAQAAAGRSGAEIEQAVIAALHLAFSRKTALSTELIVAALDESPPLSVTMAEKVATLRRWAQGRCVAAD